MIFCVEDDVSIRDLMVYALETSGHKARGFNDGAELFDALSQENSLPELIMLDIMLPGEDGMEILKKLKANSLTKDIPVIMATAKGTEFDKVLGLDTGADDFLTKPFGMMEMIARVNAVLRRLGKQSDEDNAIEIGEVRINIGTRTVTVNGTPVSLTRKEFDLLQMLMGHPEHVFSRETLLSEVWGLDYAGETRTIDVHIGTLRTKLEPYSKYIETVRGVGYRFRY